MVQTSSTEYETTDKRNPVEGAYAHEWAGNQYAVMYGFIPLGNVTHIKESFANQSFREFDKYTQFGKWLGFHGGNVAITVHGFLRGNNRRKAKAWLEFVRNLQASLAHIPGHVGIGTSEDTQWGIGNIILYLVSFFFPFSSEMSFQSNMVIKTMEFEHSAHYADEYPYIIVLEKLSWGVVQYVIDFVLNLVYGLFSVSRSRFNTPSITGGSGPTDFTLLQSFASNMNQQLTLSEIGIPPEVIENIASSVKKTIGTGNDIGNILTVVTDNEQEVTNIPGRYKFSSIIDVEQDWYDIPFLETFPQKFSFAVGDVGSSSEIIATNLDTSTALGSSASVGAAASQTTKTKYIYSMSFTVVDTIFEDTDSPKYALRVELERGDTKIYAGLIDVGIEYIFDGVLAIYIKNFNISVNSDGYITHTISGMVARID